MARKDAEYRRQELGRRRQVHIAGQLLWIVAPEDLVLSRRLWARDSRSEIQCADVRSLLASVPDLDLAGLERWVGVLGLADLYREPRR